MDESLNDVLFSVLVPAYKQRFFNSYVKRIKIIGANAETYYNKDHEED